MKTCPECGGQGVLFDEDDEENEEEYTCDRCNGTGQIPDDEE